MPSQDNAFLRHQARFLRPDAYRWVCPDAARFYQPGTKLEDVFPVLALKYNQNQPRVPAGSGRESGRWTDGDDAGSGRPRVYIITDRSEETDDAGSGDSDFGLSFGPIDFEEIAREIGKEIDKLDLFGVKPRELGGIQLAGDPPPGLGDNGGPPLDEPPKIPRQKPKESWQTTAVLRSVANWLVRKSLPVEGIIATINGIEWLRDYEDVIHAARDPAKTLDELQSDFTPRAGYDKHHIVEKSAAQRWGFSKDDTDDPDNLVMIPRLKHHQITG